MQKILNLYKKEGETPLETIEEFRNKNLEYKDVKMTYAGRLDPMAEGVLLVLVGEECKNKDKYLGLDKEYEFETLWGFQTDTYDILGIPQKPFSYSQELENGFVGDGEGKKKERQKKIGNLRGKFKQKYPPYSSMTVKGKQLFQWAREGKLGEIEIPEIETEIYNIQLLENREISKTDLENNILNRISRVKGDFRQEKISRKWKEILKETNEDKFQISKIKINCSRGTYVRSIANKLGGIAFNIKRVRVGEYDLSDSIE